MRDSWHSKFEKQYPRGQDGIVCPFRDIEGLQLATYLLAGG